MPVSDAKLIQITTDGNLRAKIEAILADVGSHGYSDIFIAEAMRTKEQQAEKVRLGYSKTMKSYHLITFVHSLGWRKNRAHGEHAPSTQ